MENLLKRSAIIRERTRIPFFTGTGGKDGKLPGEMDMKEAENVIYSVN